jgi:hypothetical protein
VGGGGGKTEWSPRFDRGDDGTEEKSMVNAPRLEPMCCWRRILACNVVSRCTTDFVQCIVTVSQSNSNRLAILA